MGSAWPTSTPKLPPLRTGNHHVFPVYSNSHTLPTPPQYTLLAHLPSTHSLNTLPPPSHCLLLSHAAALQAEADHAAFERSQLTKQIRALQEDKLTLQGEAEVTYEECDRHTQQLALVTQQLALVTDHLALVDSELRALKENHNETTEERDLVQAEADGLRERVGDLEGQLARLEESRAALEEVYEALVEEHEAVDAQARALKEDNGRLQEEVERFEEGRGRLSTALETLRQEVQQQADKSSQQEEQEALMTVAVVVGEKRERHLDVRLALLSDDNRALRHDNLLLASRVNEVYGLNLQLREALDDSFARSSLRSPSSSEGEGGSRGDSTRQHRRGHDYDLRPRHQQPQGVSLEELQGIDDADDDDDADDSDYDDDFEGDDDDDDDDDNDDDNELSRQLGLDDEGDDDDNDEFDGPGLGMDMRENELEGALVAFEKLSVLEEAYQCLMEEHEAIDTQARAWKEDNGRLQKEVVASRNAAEEAVAACHQAEGELEGCRQAYSALEEGSRQRYSALEEAYQVLCEEHAEAIRQVDHLPPPSYPILTRHNIT